MGFSLTASAATCLRTSVVVLFFTAALTASSTCYPRRSCGDADILRHVCETKGCCWDDAAHTEHRCFRGSRRESCEVLKSRTPCGISQLRQKNCVTASGESSCNEEKSEFTDTISSSEEVGVLSEKSFNWETFGDEGYDEVEMMVEVSSTEGHGLTPESNVPSQNTTSDVDELSTTVETTESIGTDGPQPAEEAADEGTLTSQSADYPDSDGKALESRPAPDEEIEPDAEEDLDLIPATGPQGDEEPSTPPSPPEISMSETLESSEDIEDMAMESQAAPEEDFTIETQSEGPQQAVVTTEDLAHSAQHLETSKEPDVGTELAEEKKSRSSVPVESETSDPEGILFRGSKSREESDIERERKYFETTKDLDDLEEPFIELAWAYGSVGAPESMVEFDLKFELALASTIQPEAVMDKTTISSSQTDSTETQEAEAVASATPPEAFDEETTISSSQTDVAETSAEVEAPAVAEAKVIPATPMREPEPRYETVLEERIEFTGSEGFVTYIPREVLVEEPLEETTESVGSLVRREGDRPTEVFGSEEDTEGQSTTDSVTSLNPQSTQSSTQDVSESITEESPEFIDNPIDFRTTDSGQRSTSQAEQSSSDSLAESEENKLNAANRKARAKHKSGVNGSLSNTDCAVSHLIPCGNGKLTKDECRDLGCCWLPLGRHFISVDCYLPQSRTNLDPHISV